MLEHWENGVLEYWNDGMLEEWKDGGKEIPPGLPLAKGGDKAKRGNKNEGKLMSYRFRKEGGMEKAGENWGTLTALIDIASLMLITLAEC